MRKFFRNFFKILFFPFQLIFSMFKWIFRKISRFFKNLHDFFTIEPEDTPLGEAFAKTVQNPGGVWEHINALRIHFFRALVALILSTSVAFSFAQYILDFIAKPAGGLGVLVAIDVTEPLSVLMKISLLAGFSVSLPYLVFEVYLFVAPGLSVRARRYGLIAMPIIVAFFLGGMAFAYYVMLPTGIPFLTSILGIEMQLRPSTYYSFATNVMFWLGIAFEFPIIIFILASLDMISAKALINQWRIAIVVISIVSAMITPTIDPVNMGLVMSPLIALYVLSIGLASIAQRKRNRQNKSVQPV